MGLGPWHVVDSYALTFQKEVFSDPDILFSSPKRAVAADFIGTCDNYSLLYQVLAMTRAHYHKYGAPIYLLNQPDQASDLTSDVTISFWKYVGFLLRSWSHGNRSKTS